MPRLSICILTYNRAQYLPMLLESIHAQQTPEVEVILSDDASSDDTPAVAASFARRMQNFHYIRREQNIGIDRHFLEAVASTSGDYVWLMGDDDRLEPGGLARVMEALDTWPDVGGLTLGVIDYDATMSEPRGIRETPPSQLIEGAGRALSGLADLLGFMSAMVVRRDAWQRAAQDPNIATFFNLYVQVYVAGRIMQSVGTWGVVTEPCVGFRTDNDQFLTKLAWKRRLAADVVAYEQLAAALLKDDPAARRAMRQRIFDTHIMNRVRSSKDHPDGDRGVIDTARFLAGYYKDLPAFWWKGLPRVLTPRRAISGARRVYRSVSGARTRPV